LGLTGNHVSDDCCKPLAAALTANVNLTLLSIRCQIPPLTSVAAVHFASALEFNNTLLKLQLRRNKIGDEGANKLAEVLTTDNATLQQLDLQSNRISVVGGLALLRMLHTNYAICEVRVALNKFERSKLFNHEDVPVIGWDERLVTESFPEFLTEDR
jgi:Ran GTPase-activating protein (RanGAP) involved in mRNA processing and transport